MVPGLGQDSLNDMDMIAIPHIRAAMIVLYMVWNSGGIAKTHASNKRIQVGRLHAAVPDISLGILDCSTYLPLIRHVSFSLNSA